jgi:hypothetical protein
LNCSGKTTIRSKKKKMLILPMQKPKQKPEMQRIELKRKKESRRGLEKICECLLKAINYKLI